MVPILSSPEKLNEGQISSLAFLGLELESSVGDLATDITLEGWELVLLGAAKMTLIVPNGALEEHSPKPLSLTGLLIRLVDIEIVTTSPLWPLAPDCSTTFGSPRWYVPALGGTGNEGFSCTSMGLHSSYSAIWSMVRFWSSLKLDTPVLWIQCSPFEELPA